jgi:hypothetical protein
MTGKLILVEGILEEEAKGKTQNARHDSIPFHFGGEID